MPWTFTLDTLDATLDTFMQVKCPGQPWTPWTPSGARARTHYL